MSANRCLLVLLLSFTPLLANAESESISVTPGSPTHVDTIEFGLSALTHTDCDLAELQSAIVTENRIDLVIFLPEIQTIAACNVVPTPYSEQVAIGPLAAGLYQIHWTYVGWRSDSYPTYSRSLTVIQGPAGGGLAGIALPSSTFVSLSLLALLLGACTWLALRHSAALR